MVASLCYIRLIGVEFGRIKSEVCIFLALKLNPVCDADEQGLCVLVIDISTRL